MTKIVNHRKIQKQQKTRKTNKNRKITKRIVGGVFKSVARSLGFMRKSEKVIDDAIEKISNYLCELNKTSSLCDNRYVIGMYLEILRLGLGRQLKEVIKIFFEKSKQNSFYIINFQPKPKLSNENNTNNDNELNQNQNNNDFFPNLKECSSAEFIEFLNILATQSEKTYSVYNLIMQLKSIQEDNKAYWENTNHIDYWRIYIDKLNERIITIINSTTKISYEGVVELFFIKKYSAKTIIDMLEKIPSFSDDFLIESIKENANDFNYTVMPHQESYAGGGIKKTRKNKTRKNKN